MPEDRYKVLFRSFLQEVFEKKNLDAFDTYVAADYVFHQPDGRDIRGLEAARQIAAAFLTAFPDLRVAADELISAEGDRLVARVTWDGCHKGELKGIPPTGRQVIVSGISVVRFAQGKMVEEWEMFDHLGLMQQLGLVPKLG